MDKFIGHLDDGRIQTLEEHLEGTATLAGQFARPFGMEEAGVLLGKNHDLGKYSSSFQAYIRGKKKRGGDHSTAGARFLWEHRKTLGPQALAGAFCIAGHHAGLPDAGTKTNQPGEKTLWGRMKNDIPEYDEIAARGFLTPAVPAERFKPFSKNPADSMMLIRMLFSCLVDADFLDTEKFMSAGTKIRGHFLSIPELAKRFFFQLKTRGYLTPANRINKKRYEILSRCMEKGEGEPGLYTLTVPTGGGKTISSMAFAMKQAVKYHKQRIIYVIPYLSIIDQTAKNFKDLLGEENVLESHSNVNYDGTEEDLADRMKLASENWDAPIVITTNEQFWESLYGSRTSKCRKLHNLADSVIIFDEAQMMPLDFLTPCLKALEELVTQYGVSAVLCSATQPALSRYLTLKPREIMENIPDLYQFFNRVTWQFDGERTYDDLVAQIKTHQQALCIASTKKEAMEIYSRLADEDSFYLSTNLCPVHRMKVIDEIRRRLKEGSPCRVVSTSIISVGVDVDFPVAYLEYTGLDSLIQGAGRCNREGRKSPAESLVHIFRTEKEMKSPFMKKEKQVTQLILRLSGTEHLSEPASISSYYEEWYKNNEGNMDRKHIMEDIEKTAFREIGQKFKLIQDSTRSVFIPLNSRAEEILEKLRQGIRTRDLMREAGQFIVNVADYENSHTPSPFARLMNRGAIAWFPGDSELAYLTDPKAYDDKTGLKTEEIEGLGIMW